VAEVFTDEHLREAYGGRVPYLAGVDGNGTSALAP
jgi:hypothetical protein